MIAIVSAQEYVDLDDVLKIPVQKGQVPLFLILDGVEDPESRGHFAQCRGSRCSRSNFPERRAAGLTDTVAKAAAGALEYVPVAKVVNIVNTIDVLKKAGVWIVGAEAGGDTVYWDADFLRILRHWYWVARVKVYAGS